jgi:hypothetical protein
MLHLQADANRRATMREWLANYETAISVVWQLFLVALGIVALPILGWLKWKFVTNPKFRKGFQVTRGKGISCILPSVKFPEQDDDPEYIAFTTPFESVLFFRALPVFAYKLGFARSQVGLCLSEMTSESELQNNVLCLGGPIHNKISKIFLDRMIDQVSFERHDLTCAQSGSRYSASIERKTVVKDVALFISAPNPWQPKSRFILLAGCRGFASVGLFDHLCNASGIDAIATQVGNIRSRLFAVFTLNVDHINSTIQYSNIKLQEIWTA